MRKDDNSVANAILEVFSHMGLPEEILTDQVSVFMGKLMSSFENLYVLLLTNWRWIEKWHTDLLSMLKKAAHKNDWDLYLPYVLFAYCQNPHCE